jgi:hypothetical protein
MRSDLGSLRSLRATLALLHRWLFACVLAALSCFAPVASAQQHPRESGDWITASPSGRPLTVPPVPTGYVTERRGAVRVSYPPAFASVFAPALRAVESDVRSLSAQLALAEVPALEVRLVPDADAMRALAPVGAPPPAYAVGVAYPSLRLTLVSARAPVTWEVSDARRVLRHELSHLLLGIATNDASIPRWFSEGVAIEQAAEHPFERFEELARASISGSLIPLSRLDESFGERHGEVNLAYAESADFVGYLLGRDGPARLGVFASHLRAGLPFDEALRRTWAMSLMTAERAWREQVANRHLLLPFALGSGVLSLASAALVFVAFVRTRRRGRATLSRWEAEDARADARAAVIPFASRAPSKVDGAPSIPEATRSVADGPVNSGVLVFMPYARRRADDLPN